MAKYDEFISDLPSQLASAKSVLIALSPQITVDELASALGLSLALQKSGKESTVVTEATPTVAQSNLFGVGEVKNALPTSGAGNFIITLENVVDPSGQMQTVPALEKLDWYPEGSNLNLVFHVIPGQRFEPSKVNFRHESQGFDLIFVIGAGSLTELGSTYTNNTAVFESSPIVNIDIASTNTNFGKYNIVNPNASSLSEVLVHLMGSLNLTLDNDIATDLIAGIYEATSNMTQKVNADTFQAAAQMISAGARLPQTGGQVTGNSGQLVQPLQQTQPEPASTDASLGGPQVVPQQQAPTQAQPVSTDANLGGFAASPWLSAEPQIQFAPQTSGQATGDSEELAQPVTQQPEVSQPTTPQPDPAQIQSQLSNFQAQPNAAGFDLRQIFQLPQMPDHATDAQSSSPAVSPVPVQEEAKASEPSPVPQTASREERPAGEKTVSTSPEVEGTPTPDWLVPKIFKGGNLG